MTHRLPFLVLSGLLGLLVAGCGPTAAARTVAPVPHSSSSPSTDPTSSSSAAPSPSSSPANLSSPSPSSSAPVVTTSAASISWLSTPIMLGGHSLGTVALPSTWNATPSVSDGNGSGASLSWSSPSGNNQLNMIISDAYGTNHNVLLQSSPFDPSLALPQSGCTITAYESSIYPFRCQGFQGFLFTGSGMQGAITVWTSGPAGSTLSRILNSIQLNNNDLN